MSFAKITVIGLMAALVPLGAAAQGSAKTAAAVAPAAKAFEFNLAMNSLLDCHFYLKQYSADSIHADPSSGVDLGSEITIYNTAERTIQDPEMWRWFEQQIVEGPDAATVRQAATHLPAALDTERNRVGAKMIGEALESAYPKFQKAVWPMEQRLINQALVGAKKRLIPAQRRIAQVLMEKMAFQPIDAPASIYVVLRSGGVTSWGKTSHGYFTVVGSNGLSSLALLESAVHEATHILDTLQPFTSSWVLKRIRTGLKGEDPKQIDIFIHGLIAYNAGELVKRFVSSNYIPEGIHAPAHAEDYQPYRSTYEVIWNSYLEGKRGTDDVVAKLIEEFKAVKKLHPAAAKPQG